MKNNNTYSRVCSHLENLENSGYLEALEKSENFMKTVKNQEVLIRNSNIIYRSCLFLNDRIKNKTPSFEHKRG